MDGTYFQKLSQYTFLKSNKRHTCDISTSCIPAEGIRFCFERELLEAGVRGVVRKGGGERGAL